NPDHPQLTIDLGDPAANPPAANPPAELLSSAPPSVYFNKLLGAGNKLRRVEPGRTKVCRVREIQ
ncbi:MAG: hypothetical protein ACRD1C_12755, partial [Terriglobales bacterium]